MKIRIKWFYLYDLKFLDGLLDMAQKNKWWKQK